MSAPPELRGVAGACACGHPLGVAAAHEVALAGGSAADAAVAAAFALAVVLPEACGLGGEAMILVDRDGAPPQAFNGAGRAPATLPDGAAIPADGGGTVAVPAAVAAWFALLAAHGRLEPAQVLAPALRLARDGFPVAHGTVAAAAQQRARLVRGAPGYAFTRDDLRAGDRLALPRLAGVLEQLADRGPGAFYEGPLAEAIVRAARADGSFLEPGDLHGHVTTIGPAIGAERLGERLAVSPPSSQAALLPAALGVLDRAPEARGADRLHVLVEALDEAFAHRDTLVDRAAAEALLATTLHVDPERAGRRGGARAYSHTTAIAAADADGTVVSMLISVFDDFGSAVLVPEGEFVLNDRLLGFTRAPNAPAPGRTPVSTLSPALTTSHGRRLAVATPGADGQVQTLAQLLDALAGGAPLTEAIARPRVRLQDGRLLVEDDLDPILEAALTAKGHVVERRPAGSDLFGAVAVAGADAATGTLLAVADPRRETYALAW